MIAGRDFRLHGLGRRQHGGANDGVHGAQQCRDGGHQEGGDQNPDADPVFQYREAVILHIQTAQGTAQPRPGADADDHAGRDNHRDKGDVVQGDMRIAVAKGLEAGNLLALAVDHATDNDVEQERGDTEEDGRKHDRHLPEHQEFTVQETVRHLPLPAYGVQAPVGRQQLIQPLDDIFLAGVARRSQNHVVEGAVHVIGVFQRVPGHPHHAVAFVIGHDGARCDLQYELR